MRFGLVALVALALSACGSQNAPVPAEPPVGRYIIVHSPHTQRDTVLLDTATGKTWEQVRIVDLIGNPDVWDAIHQMNSPEDYAALGAEVGAKTGPDEAYPACGPKVPHPCFTKPDPPMKGRDRFDPATATPAPGQTP